MNRLQQLESLSKNPMYQLSKEERAELKRLRQIEHDNTFFKHDPSFKVHDINPRKGIS